MVFEQVMTIVLGTGAGAALVLFTKPRQYAAEYFPRGISLLECISLPYESAESQVVEGPVAGVVVTSSSQASTISADAASTSSSVSAVASIATRAVSPS